MSVLTRKMLCSISVNNKIVSVVLHVILLKKQRLSVLEEPNLFN